jgi:hypothetical protein
MASEDIKIEDLDSSGEEEYDSEEDDGIGFRVFCDASQATITFGDWYHKRGEDYDLCEKEYQKLSEDEKNKFVKIDTPEDLGEDLGEYVGEDDDLEDMNPEQILEMIREAFIEKEGRAPTEEEAAAFMQMIEEAQEEGEEDSDGWVTDEGEDESDDESDDGGIGPMFVPDKEWSVRDLKAFIKDNGGSFEGVTEKDELLELAKSLAKPAAPQLGGFGAPGAFSFSLPGSDATPAPAPAGAFSFSIPGSGAPAPAPGTGKFAFQFNAPGGAAGSPAGSTKFNFNIGQTAEARAASQSTAAAPAEKVAKAGEANAPVSASSTTTTGASALPAETVPESEYERQVRLLTEFYAKHDPAKDASACRAILDKRRKAAPYLHEVAWKDLCSKLGSKYGGEDPESLSSPAPAPTPAPAPAPTTGGSTSAKAEAEAAKANRLAKIASAPDGGQQSKDPEDAALESQVQTLAKFYAKHEPVSCLSKPSRARSYLGHGTAFATLPHCNLLSLSPPQLVWSCEPSWSCWVACSRRLAALQSKTAEECRSILKKRLGPDQASMPAKDWVKLCGKIGKKYGEDPLSL